MRTSPSIRIRVNSCVPALSLITLGGDGAVTFAFCLCKGGSAGCAAGCCLDLGGVPGVAVVGKGLTLVAWWLTVLASG